MDLNKVLESDSHTFKEVMLYLEMAKHTLERFQEYCPSTHNYLCAEAFTRGQSTLSGSVKIISNTIDNLNAGITNQTTTLIDLPEHWKIPKFQFGQITEQGTIVGMNYHPAISPNGNDERWVYLVQAFATGKLETIEEFKIELIF